MDEHFLPAAQDGFKWEFHDFRLVPGTSDTFGWNVDDIINQEPQSYAIEVVLRSVSWSSLLLGDTEIVLRFVDPLSHRVSVDEALNFYGYAMASEEVPKGSIYTIEESSYLAEFSDSDAAMEGGLTHYMMHGLSQFCIEVITRTPLIVMTQSAVETPLMWSS
jgi:hypothetical protein